MGLVHLSLILALWQVKASEDASYFYLYTLYSSFHLVLMTLGQVKACAEAASLLNQNFRLKVLGKKKFS